MAFRTTYSQELVAWNLPTSPFFKFLKVKRGGHSMPQAPAYLQG